MRRALASTAFLAAAAASVGHANASCTYNSVATPSGVFALTGDVCTAAAGTYVPTVQPDVSLPVTYTGFGFFAYSGGVINNNSPNAVTINTTGANNAYGAWSDGTGAQINLAGGTTVSTTGANSYGLFANLGGAISATAPVTITTLGADAAGVQADTGGAISLTGGAVTTSLAGSQGLFANGAGSLIAASGMAVTTNGGFDPSTGRYAHGAEAFNGGSLTFSAGSITTNGASVAAVASLGAGSSVTLTGGTTPLTSLTIQTTGNGSNGLAVSGGASLTATGVSIMTRGTVDSSTGFNAFGAYNGSNPLFSTGGAMTLTDVTIATLGQGASGVVANSGGVTTLSGGSVTTSGDNALGLHATGAGSSITTQPDEFGVATTISTEGSFAHGVQADTGGAVTLNGGSVAVTGTGSLGLFATGTGSTINATDVAVSTAGSGLATANAIYANAGAMITVSGGAAATTRTDAYVIAATGGAAINLSGTTVTATADGSGGLAANGTGSTITATGLTITTHGNFDTVNSFGPAGIANQSYPGFPGGGVVTLTNSTILTTGTQATGVYTANGGTTKLTGDSITTSGANSIGVFTDVGGTTTLTNPTISTSGANSSAILTRDGGSATVDGGTVSTSGVFAHAVLTQGSGTSVSVNGATLATTGNGSVGADLVGTGSSMTLTNVSITTSGTTDPSGHNAVGVFNGSASSGLFPGGGTALITNTTVLTTGANAGGVVTESGGSTKVNGGSIATTNVQSDAVLALSGAQVTVQGTTISTSGDASKGFDIQGTGTMLTATGVNVTTTGTINPATGNHAQGLYNGNGDSSGLGSTGGGVAIVTDSTFLTKGVDSIGVDTLNGGRTTVTGGLVTTTGASSAAVVADSSAFVSLTGTSVNTTGAGSTGLGVNGGGTADAKDVTIATFGGQDSVSGDDAIGVYNGPSGPFTAGGVAMLTDSSVSTHGAHAVGVLTNTGGSTTILGGSISTSGPLAFGILTESGGTTTVGVSSVGPTTITTSGNDAPVVIAQSGGFVSLAGATISATGAMGSSGLVIHDAGSELDAANVTVTTTGGADPATGRNSYGLYNGPFETSVAGGVAKVTDSSISTQGAGMYGVVTSTGGATTLTRTSVATGGLGAIGVLTNAGGATNIGGGSVATTGQDAHALFVTGSGSTANLSGTTSFATLGNGAIGLYATLGGVISATGAMTIATAGGVSPSTGLGAYGVNADGAGSQIKLGAATITTSGAGASALFASDASSSGSAGTITATGPLNVKTTNASTAAVALQGNGASVSAIGGGMIASAGDAIAFLGGTGQSATFDFFSIRNLSDDLIFADPSVSTVNFFETTANAGTNNLLDATAGSDITLNAIASALTGAIRTDATSTSNVNLANGTTWNMTGSSTVTNLSVTNSVVVFAPPGSGQAFKTLTVTNYVGSGAMITMNASLGGSNSASDQIIVNGGKATGTTFLTINNVGGLGAQTTGAGIPVIIATNGGTIASGAFDLANTPAVGGFKYSLDETNGQWYLVSSPTTTPAQVQNSVNNVAKAQQTQIITNRVLNSILLGATQQISTCSCGGGFASAGSFAAGAQGRWGLSDELSLIGGFSYNQWSSSGITVENAPTVAGSLVYDFYKQWGVSRPFVEVGGALTPYEDVHYSRSYANGDTTAVGNAAAIDRDLSLFARAGWIDRFTPTDEAAVYGDLSRNWMQTGGYTEMTSFLNPFPATVSNGLDTLNVARLGGQWTHLFNGNIEANVSGAVAYGFGVGAGAAESVYDFGPIAPNALPNTTWVEYGARLGYRFNDRLVIDAFIIGTAFGQVGTTVHGGVGVRYAF